MKRRWGSVTGAALVLAAVWSVALIVLALVAPAYQTGSDSATMAPDGTTTITTGTTGTATMVQVNGIWVVLLLCIPLAVTGLVALLLRFADRTEARIGAWALTLLLCGFCVLGLMSVGLFIAPIAAALVVACVAVRPGAPLQAALVEGAAVPRH